MRQKILVLCMLTFVCVSTFAQTVMSDPWEPAPWGVSAHLRKKPHLDHRRGLLDRAKSANIKWIRDSFQFSNIFKDMNTMDFTAYDELFADTDEFGVSVLGVLEAYDSELLSAKLDRYVPIYNHLDAWLAYVRATVERYCNRIKYWEVWNEQDGGFWKPTPDAVQYVKLLKVTYETIKEIDPEAVVLVGGLKGFNDEYLKAMYDAGAKGYFDAIAVHPYQYGIDVNRKVASDRIRFLEVLAEQGEEDIPVWITECGGSSYTADLMAESPDFLLKAIRYSLAKIGRSNASLKVGVALSPRQSADEVESTRTWLPGVEVKPVPFECLATLDPEDYPVLIGVEGSTVDEPLLEPLRAYVERGGLMIAVNLASSSIPFSTICEYDEETRQWKDNTTRLASTMQLFRMKYEASWTMPGGAIPESTSKVRTAPDALAWGVPAVSKVYVNRFVNGGNMQDGDTYYPIVEAYNGTEQLPADGMGLYTYGDWKGGVLYSAIKVQTGYTTERQANLLQRVYLSYLSLGIEKIFWYDLHNDGATSGETEQNFGLVDVNGNPKPSYWAYRNMTRSLGVNPHFEERLDLGNDSVWALVFRRLEDGKRVLAIWSTADSTIVDVSCLDTEVQRLTLENNIVQFIELSSGNSVIEHGDMESSTFYVSGLRVHLMLPTSACVSLFDLSGRCLVETDVSSGKTDLPVPTAGVYILRVNTSASSTTYRIVAR